MRLQNLKRSRPRRQWCFNVIVVCLILQAALNAFLLYKVFTSESSPSASPHADKQTGGADLSLVQNNSKELQNLEGHLWALKTQLKTVCSDQISRLQTDVVSLNSSTRSLDSRLTTISLTPGPSGPAGTAGRPGEPGPKGDRGDAGPTGSKGEPGQTGEPGPAGSPGPQGPTGPTGTAGDQGPGAKGEKGDPGLQGPQGEKGDTGLAGTPGLPGDKGDTGLPGPPGIASPPGSQGIPGLPGQKGEKGDAAQRESNVRLIPGPSRGRVEVQYNNVWGTVCDDNFDTVDGKVICKILGFHTALSTYTAPPGSGRIWLDELRCRGTETDIFSCPHAGMGMNNCQHNEDVGVQCV